MGLPKPPEWRNRTVLHPFIWLGRCLNQQNGYVRMISGGIVAGWMEPLKAADNYGFSIVRFSDNQQVRHAMRRRIAEQILEHFENAFGTWVRNPVRLPQPTDPFPG